MEITRIKFFWALLPDKNFYARVINDKDRARKLVGEQLYLSDPPHLTLYVADFADSESLPAVTEEIARGIGKAPTVTITAWHVFYHDNLTGKTTLVYEISTDGSAALRSAQATAVCMASPYRDPYACRQRYDAVWEKLGDEERRNVEAAGFPYIGDIWIPHVTIASFDDEKWETVWVDFSKHSPHFSATFSSLGMFQINDDGASVSQMIIDLL